MENTVTDMFRFVENCKECVIYGAGNYGKRLYELLTIFKFAHKVKCFAVSEHPEKQSSNTKLRVISFEDVEKTYPDAAILVAIKEGKELYEKVKKVHEGAVFLIKKETLSLSDELMEKWWESPVEERKILFISSSGKGYMCNGKYITEELLRQGQDVDMVWAVNNMGCKVPDGVRKVKKDSCEYYHEVATARVWIDNERKDIQIKKRDGQYYIQTWHGSGPLKKVEKDVEDKLSPEYVRIAKHDGEMIDLFLSSTSANSYMYRNSFYSNGEILECGSPRNDVMFQNPPVDRNKVLHSLGIEDRKAKIVLYAPTFRSTREESAETYDLDAERVISELNKKFQGEFIMLLRFHCWDVSEFDRIKKLYVGCINTTGYEDTQELLAISDVLITDYSSIMWDFSLKRAPVFLYQNDAQQYMDGRGFYCHPDEWPYPRAYDMDGLCKAISEFKQAEYTEKVDAFLKRWSSFDDGFASKRAAARIMDVINNPQKYQNGSK
ncbi:MAG: hypothetical protein HFH00_11955 [Dorea sp.]|nr:hypothetical protein [Dorea sp.]